MAGRPQGGPEAGGCPRGLPAARQRGPLHLGLAWRSEDGPRKAHGAGAGQDQLPPLSAPSQSSSVGSKVVSWEDVDWIDPQPGCGEEQLSEWGGLAAEHLLCSPLLFSTFCLHGSLGEVAWHTERASVKTEKGKLKKHMPNNHHFLVNRRLLCCEKEPGLFPRVEEGRDHIRPYLPAALGALRPFPSRLQKFPFVASRC